MICNIYLLTEIYEQMYNFLIITFFIPKYLLIYLFYINQKKTPYYIKYT